MSRLGALADSCSRPIGERGKLGPLGEGRYSANYTRPPERRASGASCQRVVLGVRGLIFAVWWVWPRFQALTFSAELVMIVLWLITGTAAWLVALNLGRQRFWHR